jgi:hypothetical protein
MERNFEYPRVVQVRPHGQLRMARPVIRSQRGLVEASLLMCPQRRSPARRT